MAKAQKKKRNPNDSTFRNINALKRRVKALETEVLRLNTEVLSRLNKTIASLERIEVKQR